MITKYDKLAVALAGILIGYAARHGFDLSEHQAIITDLITGAFTAFMVYVVPNKTERTLS